MRVRIENVTLVTTDETNRVFENGCLVWEDDTILALNDFSVHVDEVIDGQGGLLLPGMVNTHCHLGMIPFRSLGDDCPDRLRRFLFPLENAAMTRELAQASARYAAAEMMLGGVTTVFDMYYFEDALAEAMVEMNMRAVLAETIVDFANCDSDASYGGLALGERFIQEWKGRHPLITPAIGPHATNTNSAEVLKQAQAIAERCDVLLSLHTAEMDYEMETFRKERNQTPIEYLESIGLLSPHLVAAHCIHVNDQDLALMAKYGCRIAHCIGSNMKAGKGIAPLKKMVAHHIPVGLGTDGASSGNTLDLFAQLPLIGKAHKTANHDRALFPAKEILPLATIGGARVLNLDDQIGSLTPGKKADLVLVETQSANMFPIYDPFSALVYSAHAGNVDSVWVNGVQTVKHKQLVRQDLRSLREDLEAKMQFFKAEALRRSEGL
ncbi:amidohydrolase [Holdemania filiformis]|uniref:amidohydrolase n=1 Tax=Holdemania filiformis TaxID=61171 RepID=UPI002430EC4E|nr:amidohydrolase [Holdemania filiformis]